MVLLSLPHHLRALIDHAQQYSRGQQAVIALFWLAVIAAGAFVVGIELLVAIGAVPLLDLLTDPIYRLLDVGN